MRLIDADALLASEWDLCDAIEAIKNAPTVDAVPAVRCYECKKSFVPKRDEYGNPGYLLCTRWGDPMSVDFLDFCSCGERKDDDNA